MAPPLPPRPSLLIVDDEHDIRRTVTRAMRRMVGRVREASDGVEALEAIRESVPDLMVLDIRMPRMDGIELLTRLREEGMQLPVLMISGYSDREVPLAVREAGPWRYLDKPFCVEELRACAIELLDAGDLQVA